MKTRKKKSPVALTGLLMRVGSTVRFFCVKCRTEFAIVHEPDYIDSKMRKAFGGRAKEVEFCPFCGDVPAPE